MHTMSGCSRVHSSCWCACRGTYLCGGQLRRLRCAIEVDCDARVLKAGHDTASYGETLIVVGQRRSLYIGRSPECQNPSHFWKTE